jgi:hypothetical protein
MGELIYMSGIKVEQVKAPVLEVEQGGQAGIEGKLPGATVAQLDIINNDIARTGQQVVALGKANGNALHLIDNLDEFVLGNFVPMESKEGKAA